MRLLGKMKLLAFSAVILFGMSACLKSSDPGFQFGVSSVYMLQSGSDATARFSPMMQIYAYEPIQRAEVTNTNSLIFTTHAVNSTRTVIDLLPITSSVDSIPNGIYTINASNAEGEIASLPITFSIDKRLGEFKVNSLTYTEGGIKASWDLAAQATGYYLLVREKGSKVWQIYQWNGGSSEKITEGTFTASWQTGYEVEVTVGATYEGVLFTIGIPGRPDGYKSIVWGTYDQTEEN